MAELDEYIKLADKWHAARDDLAIARLELDLKMVEYLRGKGRAPIMREMHFIDYLACREADTRCKMDQFISNHYGRTP